MTGDIDRRRKYLYPAALIFALFFFVLFALHIPLLRLPYFWDEAGYYVPAARDLLLHGTLIPHSTPSNAHPPLVMAYLALAWKVLGYAPVVTRTAMLAVAAFSLLGVFRLAQRVANTEVAVASAICTALYPVFFAQSSLAHLDLAAAGLTFWGLLAYVEDRRWATAVWFSLAVLAKETAILAPLALFAWELLRSLLKLDARKRKRAYCVRAKAPSSILDPARALVCLPLRAHRIRLRQPGVLPLQRASDSAATPRAARARAAPVAGRGISQPLLPHLGSSCSRCGFRPCATTAKSANEFPWMCSFPFSR